MSKTTTRCEGAFIGHAIASRYDPAILLAMNLTDSLLQNKTMNGPDIASRYLHLYHTNRVEIGAATKSVYHQLMVHNERKSSLTVEDFRFNQSTIDETVRLAHKQCNEQTAGCGPAHRSYPLAFCPYIADYDVFDMSMHEARLTHHSPLAGQVAGIVNVICRNLLRDVSWADAVTTAFESPRLDSDVVNIRGRYHRFVDPLKPVHIAYAPTALNSALHFVEMSKTAEQAITNACSKDIYFCAPLVGILAGTRWGIPKALYEKHITDAQLKPLQDSASRLTALWETKIDNTVA